MIPASLPMHIYLMGFVFGAIVGSFLNVCILRLPNGESIVSPPSHCPACKTTIPFYDNIPLISYLFLRARCRFCDTKISPRYFVIELLTGAFGVALLMRFGLGPAFIETFIFVAALIVISFIDLDVRIVPDVISLPGIALGLLFSVINRLFVSAEGAQAWIGWQALFSTDHLSALPSPMSSLVGIVLGGGSLLLVAWGYQLFTGREGMGGGDIKLLAMIGAFLGWPSVPLVLFLSSLTGSVVGLLYIWLTGANGKYALPFAPFLCLGALLHLFFGTRLIGFYLSIG
jgi:leader peptidase (prepilin peptidase)/N-methyltransferase